MWDKQTESVRKQHVYGVCREKALDAPELSCKLPPDFFLRNSSDEDEDEDEDENEGVAKSNYTTSNAAEVDAVNMNTKNNNNDKKNNNNPWVERLLDRVPSRWKDKGVSSPGQRP